jgi:hypothetical protein
MAYPDAPVGDSQTSELNNPEFNEQGKNKRLAIKDATQALKIAQVIHYDDEKRDIDRSRVLAAFNGAAPYDQCELEAIGQSYRFNVSFGHMEGVIGRGTMPYLEIVNDEQYIANIDADLPEEKLAMIREEFSAAVKRWGRWPRMTNRLIQDLVLNGYNTACLPSDYSPWPVFVPQKDGFAHDMAANDVGDLELFVWKKSYLIHELYEMIEDPEVAERAGWNVANCRLALEKAVPEKIYENFQSGSWTAIESAIRGGALYATVVGDKKIDTYHVFATEVDGKVSHWVVNRGRGDKGADQPVENVELFKRVSRFPAMDEFMIYFDLEAGDGKWHGSRGLGKRSFNTHRAIDKLRCAVLDQAFTSGLTILQAKEQDSQEDFQLAMVGPFAVIPAGIDVSATTVPAISSTTFQVDALLSSTSEQRIGDVVPNTNSPVRKGSKTATEANISAERSVMVSRSNLQRFIHPLSKMLSLMVRRLLKENSPDADAKRFQQALINRGFSHDDFKKVRGAKSTGNLDKVLGADRQNYSEIVATYRGDPDINQLEIKRRQLESIVGQKEVHGLLINDVDGVVKIEAQRAQIEELSTMIDGLPVPVSPRDPHEIHASVLLDWLAGQLQVQSQGKNGASISIIQLAIQHCGQHIEALALDKSKKQISEQMKQGLQQIMAGFQQLAQQVQAQLQARMGGAPPAGAPPAPASAEMQPAMV